MKFKFLGVLSLVVSAYGCTTVQPPSTTVIVPRPVPNDNYPGSYDGPSGGPNDSYDGGRNDSYGDGPSGPNDAYDDGPSGPNDSL